MRKISEVVIKGVNLETILENHRHWLSCDCDGWKDMKAVLRNADLSYIDFSGCYLGHIDLEGSILESSNFTNANLEFAHLVQTNCHDALFFQANLRNARLTCANLTYAYFQYADLRDASFRLSNLHRADFTDANINGADFEGANLSCTEFAEANTYRFGKMLTEDIIGYKKCRNDVIVTLQIPRGAIVFSVNGKKCRTNKAKVIAIDGANRAYSCFDRKKSYYVGDILTVYNFNCQYNQECSTGIHFFKTRKEAEKYYG